MPVLPAVATHQAATPAVMQALVVAVETVVAMEFAPWMRSVAGEVAESSRAALVYSSKAVAVVTAATTRFTPSTQTCAAQEAAVAPAEAVGMAAAARHPGATVV